MSLKGSYDVVVIGAGPAGLSAAIYLARSKASFIVLEKGAPGGKLLTIPELENYPGFIGGSGATLASNFYMGATSLGANIAYGDVLEVSKTDNGFLIKTDDGDYEAKFVIAATGLASVSAPLKNEKKYLGHGVSTCATCDGNFFRGEKMVISGSGDRTLQEAIYLAGLASELTYLVPGDRLTGKDSNIAKLTSLANVEIIYNAKPLSIEGDEVAKSLEYVKDDEHFFIEAKGFFPIPLEGGQASYLKNLEIEKEGNFYRIDLKTAESSLEGLYIAGDLVYGVMKQVVTAASLGALAASSIIKRL